MLGGVRHELLTSTVSRLSLAVQIRQPSACRHI